MHPELLEYQGSAGAGETALHYLVIENRLEAVQYLIARGADVNTREHGTTPLMNAAILGLTEMIQLLVSHGAQINARDDLEETALHYAASRDRLETVELLLRLGADRTIQNESGYTAADEAKSPEVRNICRVNVK